jgi:hypothetical protein
MLTFSSRENNPFIVKWLSLNSSFSKRDPHHALRPAAAEDSHYERASQASP